MSSQTDSQPGPGPAQRRLVERGQMLVSLLRRGKRDHQRDILLWGGLRIAAGVALLSVLMLLLSSWLPILPLAASVAATIVLWCGIGFLVWRHWVRPLRAIPNLKVFSRLIEERRDFRDMLRAALEFSERGVPGGTSVDLVLATVDKAYDEASALQLPQLFEFPSRRRDGSLVAAGALVLTLVSLWNPAVGQRALQGFVFAYPTPASIVWGELQVVGGGDCTVLAGDDVVVRLRDHGPLAPEMVLRFNDTGDLWKTRQLQPVNAQEPWEYTYRFENVRDNTDFRFESGNRQTADFKIEVVQRPIVHQFTLRLIPPPYTGRDPVTLEEGRGDAIALVGTQIELRGEASTPLRRGAIEPVEVDEAAISLPTPLSLEIDGSSFAAEFLLRSNVSWRFDIMDNHGHKNADPVTYRLTTIEDRAPYVEIREPQGDASIPKSLVVPVFVYASDDFGISGMRLVYQHEREGEGSKADEKTIRLELSGRSATDPEGRPLTNVAPEVVKIYEWNLNEVGLYPGDYVSFYVEVEDNDEFSGHKTARTPTLRLRLPTLAELYADLQEKDEHRMTDLEEVLEKGRDVWEKFEQMARELKKRPEMDWKKEQEIDRAIEKQKELAEQVQEISREMKKELDRMEEQQLVSQQVAEKMEAIRELMEQVESETMREYMEQLQKAMKEITPEEVQRQLEEMQLSQEEFLERLERTKNLLEQLKREQELDSMIERTADLLQRQEEVSEQTRQMTEEPKSEEGDKSESEAEQSAENQSEQGQKEESAADEKPVDPDEAKRLAEEQKKLAEEMQKLQEELDKLAQEFQENQGKELNDAQEQAQEEDPSEQMDQASKNLKQQQPQQAQQNQQQAEQSLRKLYEQLMEAQMAMNMNMEQQSAEALTQAARQSLDVSFRQEHLSREQAPMGDFDSTGDLARQQQALRQSTGKVIEGLDEMAQKSLSIPPAINAMLGEAMNLMDAGVEAYEKGNALAGRVRGEEAYAQLNKVVIELNRSARACMASCSSGQQPSSLSARQKMQQMTQRQQQLNDATRQMQDRLQNQGQLTAEERAQMSRMLGEQSALEQALQDIEKQAADEKDLLGRMDRMRAEMKEVIEDMESDVVTEETLRIQERIVSRMLQAQRSMHKRDYNKQRESRVGEEIYSEGGKSLDLEDARRQLRRDIQRALESETPEEYEELVRQYFRAISEGEADRGDTP